MAAAQDTDHGFRVMPTDPAERKGHPIVRGMLDYFPDACAKVAELSRIGNDQHNPGQPMHWARDKSTDHADCIVRHLIDRGKRDSDGVLHDVKVAWRALANLQVTLEEQDAASDADGSASAAAGDADQVNKSQEKSSLASSCPQYVNAGEYRPPKAGENYRSRYTGDVLFAENDWPDKVSRCIVRPRRVYVAGPMRGYRLCNFPAFDTAAGKLKLAGWDVVNPAELDREAGIDPAEVDQMDEAQQSQFLRDCMRRDLQEICSCDALALLPGWEDSHGVAVELQLAKMLGLMILDARTLRPLDPIKCHSRTTKG